MHVKWFGAPWPSEERRAPICEDDNHKVETPVGRDCIECDHEIGERDHGVITACSVGIWGHWKLEVDGVEYPVCAYHLHCFLKNTLGPELGPKILARMRERPLSPELFPPNEKASQVTPIEEEDAVQGRGWKKTEEPDLDG